jgi:hypothetical protein
MCWTSNHKILIEMAQWHISLSTFSNQIFDLLDFSITDLSFADFLLQGRFYFNSDPSSMRNYAQIESSQIFH